MPSPLNTTEDNMDHERLRAALEYLQRRQVPALGDIHTADLAALLSERDALVATIKELMLQLAERDALAAVAKAARHNRDGELSRALAAYDRTVAKP